MADTMNRRTQVAAAQPSRLQRRAPASIQVSRCTDWNVAIPLLSPLDPSPTAINLTAEIEASRSKTTASVRSEQGGKPAVFKKWQHPAAPFCYESGAPTTTTSFSFGPFGSCGNEFELRIKS